MIRAKAIIGSVIGGLVAFGVLLGGEMDAAAQGAGSGMGPSATQPSGPSSSAAAPPDAMGEGAGSARPPGSSPGRSLVENLNRALENALSGKGVAPQAGSMPLVAPERRAAATRGPVVVELFTSQGCSSCPPADEIFGMFATRPDVIALSLHVDYWDYLGWEDPFAQPAFTQRQKGYARAAGSRSIYTPQMIIEGGQSLVGADAVTLAALVEAERTKPAMVQMSASGRDGQYQIELRADPPLPQGAVVQIVRYAPKKRVEILRGENAGMVVNYSNVVTAWHAVADWDGRTPTRLTARIEGDDPAVVIVQVALPGKSAPLPGPILAAARLN